MTQHRHIGSTLDDLLESDGTLEQAEADPSFGKIVMVGGQARALIRW